MPRQSLSGLPSAPNSISLTALVGGDERVREAPRHAVTVALQELERYTQARTGGNNGAETRVSSSPQSSNRYRSPGQACLHSEAYPSCLASILLRTASKEMGAGKECFSHRVMLYLGEHYEIVRIQDGWGYNVSRQHEGSNPSSD